MRRSQNASARDAGGVPVPLFIGDVAVVAWRELGIDATDALRAERGRTFDLLEIPNLNNHRNLSKVRKIRSLDVPVAGSSQ
jgi:hypothetical protein